VESGEHLALEKLGRFTSIPLVDFEFIAGSGERPDVVCMCVHDLRSGQKLRLWRHELGSTPPYDISPDSLFVSFVGNAELACHLALGWDLPVNILDLSPAFRNIINGRSAVAGKGLIGAQLYYGVDSISTKRKDAMRTRILRGWPFTDEEMQSILDYCMDDALALLPLLQHILEDPDFDLDVALYHGAFVACLARMENRGVPIDMATFDRLANRKTWSELRDALVPAIDVDFNVYVRTGGDWTFNTEKFAAYLVRAGITGWPLTEDGKLSLKDKTFREMSKGFPALEPLRQLRHTRNKMRRIKLAVGADGKNRCVLWPFASKTSRVQPKASEWIFSPAVWIRHLIKPESGMAIAYIDYSAAEFMIGASLSDGHCGPGNPMLRMYQSGDPYLSYAKSIGAVPPDATKTSHAVVRDKYKVFLLATQYGMSHATLAARLGVSEYEAQLMLAEHHAQFAQYWAWSDDWLQHALQTGVMRTQFGWFCRVGIVEFNERSIRNWPVQSTCSEVLRVACIMMERHRLRLLASVHDAVLIEAPIERIEADVALAREIMRRASRVVLNASPSGTHELRTGVDIVKYPDAFTDARGTKVWTWVMQQLEQIDAAKSA